ncbi:histidine kinase [Brachybacterium sp. JB7]|uniref:sensor histidine kinase n=1 Tax=Brachybacterium TaxID=43668 RepID=UPI000DF390F1|nr:histidine kinase [Brachybacterium sp. JB7]RCS65618.1 histidine kinase [Brachybacterium sp. JB7]
MFADPPEAPASDAVPARPRVARKDVLMAAGYAAAVLLLAATGARNSGFVEGWEGWPRWFSVLILLVACTSLVWRRRLPVLPLVVAGPLAAAEVIVGGQISAYLLLFEALFEPIMHGSKRLARFTTGTAISLAVLALLIAVGLGASGPILLVVVLVASLVVSTPLLWGWEVRHHRDARVTAESLTEMEHELAATRAAHAVETERRKIAHDLHDVIAGHLSAVSLHTNLAASLEQPEARDSSLATARDSAHAALRDLRSMIGVLSTEHSATLPSVTLDWPSLTARLHGRDPDASVSIAPAVEDPSRVEPSVQAALLRIAAEASTNAVRHGLAPITLAVRVESAGNETTAEGVEGLAAEMVTFELTNRRAQSSVPGTGVGRGAIAYRAAAVGGSATSGPAPADGPDAGSWRVLAHLPSCATGRECPTELDAEGGPGAGAGTDASARDASRRDAATTSPSTNQEVTP